MKYLLFINKFIGQGAIIKVIFGAALLMNSICTYAWMQGLGSTGNPCASGGLGVTEYFSTGCSYDGGNIESNATVLWGAGQVWSPVRTVDIHTMADVYPPFTGVYEVKQYFCPSKKRASCLISKATASLISNASAQMSSQKTVEEANANFRGFSGTVSESSNACFTLVDERGYEWGALTSPIMCQDAPNVLPETPADCYLNGNMDLTIDMGSLERSKIATIPASGSAGNIKKSFPVLCTRDAGITVLTSFQFTPLTISGNEVVTTNASNLGVAIFYKGNLVGPSSTPVTESFGVGYTDRELEFQAVRNPNAALDDIPTGNFNASAVMIMTAQ